MVLFFQHQLDQWYDPTDRPMPWKEEKNPYKIWLSEIILQQTTVAQGTSYYNKFIAYYPDVFSLAKASQEEVLQLWQGLGYYSRARNLHIAAQQIVENFNGIFPKTLKSLQSLKGVGPYTASAIASFAFGLPHPVVDGNVKRVVSRYLGMQEPIDISSTHKAIETFVGKAIKGTDPAQFNQSIMDFGATICTPKNYKCTTCLLQKKCKAYALKAQAVIPFKSKKIIKKHRYFHYLCIHHNNGIYIKKRAEKDIWEGLFELPLQVTKEYIKAQNIWSSIIAAEAINEQSVTFKKQSLTHQIIHFSIFNISIDDVLLEHFTDKYLWIPYDKISEFAFPRTLQLYLQKLI